MHLLTRPAAVGNCGVVTRVDRFRAAVWGRSNNDLRTDGAASPALTMAIIVAVPI
ncbi:hypothetical protein HUK38_02815 [Thiospirillum jenense]|uniref:Uncharacterized protein n=1 Tax=Thiospirillum jenense TaxID=1653858 RepID=A0A839HFJ2_9GAMM|nr:hypothetical protein [Thiospirillum jenense]